MIKKEFGIDKVNEVLSTLAKKDKFFVSEAHLQTEFIIMAKELYKDYEYYPELVPSIDKMPEEYSENDVHFDLLINANHQKVLIEFKYLAKEFSGTIDDMQIHGKSHFSLSKRRYDCWKDIERIEKFTYSNKTDIDYGYFILITNSSSLWNKTKETSLDYEFHIEEGVHKAGIKRWKDKISDDTKKKRYKPIEITKDYNFEYKEYSSPSFKQLVVEIG